MFLSGIFIKRRDPDYEGKTQEADNLPATGRGRGRKCVIDVILYRVGATLVVALLSVIALQDGDALDMCRLGKHIEWLHRV